MSTYSNKFLEALLSVDKQACFALLEKRFPNSVNRINTQKAICYEKLIDLRAYIAALNSVITSF